MHKAATVFLWSILQLALANAPRKRRGLYFSSPVELNRESQEPEVLPPRTRDEGKSGHLEPSIVRAYRPGSRSPNLQSSSLSMMEISAEGTSKTVREQTNPAHLAVEIDRGGVALGGGVAVSGSSQLSDNVQFKSAAQKTVTPQQATQVKAATQPTFAAVPVASKKNIAKEEKDESKPPTTIAPVTSTRKIAKDPPIDMKKLNGLHLEHLKQWSEQEKLNSFFAEVEPLGSTKDTSMSGAIGHILDGLSGGTGTVMEPTQNKELDREIRFRMRMQDIAVLVLLMLVYFAILFFMYSLIYRMSNSDSAVKYYCDPSYHRLACQSDDVESFLKAFNMRPARNKPQIRVAGFAEKKDHESLALFPWLGPSSSGVSPWRGKDYNTLFYYALDLDNWTEEEGMIDEKDRKTVEDFLVTHNPLETVVIRKEMVWSDFEEVATNLRAKIRACGFEGPLDISMSPPDTCRVYQNARWANFLYNETVKVMTLLSIIGGLVYLPYMWIRSNRQRKLITSKFNISISGKDYWQLISPHISAHGFGLPQGENPSAPQIRQADNWQVSQENNMPEAADRLLGAYVNG